MRCEVADCNSEFSSFTAEMSKAFLVHQMSGCTLLPRKHFNTLAWISCQENCDLFAVVLFAS